MISGFFALGGALIGGLLTYGAARIGHRWRRAQSDIAMLCDQVAAYYELEKLYKVELAKLDPAQRSAKVVMEEMRLRVSQSGEFERPQMTSFAAGKLRRKWRRVSPV